MSEKEVMWLLRGDFNTVRFEHEKTGRADVGRSVAAFNEFINNTTLLDLPLTGDKFTWCGFRERWVFSRLDRFLVNVEWLNGSQELVQQCLPSSLSDHCPIDKLNGAEGIVEDPESIKREVVNHFQKLYTKQLVLDVKEMDWEMGTLKRESAEYLEKPFKEEEFWATIQGCDDNKAPGPDGYNLNFFKNQWNVVKKEVMKFMGDFHKEGGLGCGVNASFITLILKVQNPTSLGEYRPISLVGNLYKIVAKTLANRLRNVIGEVIGRNQFAFIKGKQLMDCALIANEMVDCVVVGDNGMSVTHLQYADDTIIFCEPKIENMSRVKQILRCFQSVSGLRINFSKSHLIGIGVEQNLVENWARRISCQIGEVPTTYLGLPLGVNHNSWDKVCNYKECGGIGITNIEVKNRALLNKWIWRYGKERDSLWREVLVAKTKSDPTMLLPSQVWANLAPYRVEAFAWQLLHGKIVVKDELDKRGMLLGNAIQ
ncbi:Uncharacterized protein TCM_018759 [Theobroma cacao]|uniref:Reverse transcriptase domain-containing protein n=1 Tax=Theobroma cacao TaxID=3641 RepID=A0A061EMZ4_THECC|nr:Uncharacterized protein TCM_018759 [Theobroma cacao]